MSCCRYTNSTFNEGEINMINFIIGLFIGLFLGAFLGIVIMALCSIAKKSDNDMVRMFKEKENNNDV